MLLEHLFDDQFTVVNHAINLWTAILSTEKQSIVLIQDYPTGGTVHAFQVLVFMLINLMADVSVINIVVKIVANNDIYRIVKNSMLHA